jgi:hypothetical protein
MQFNNLVASSIFDKNRVNAYTWTQNYNGQYITLPRTLALISGSLCVSYLSFRENQTNLYINYANVIRVIPVPNGYYDDINEFLPVLQTATTNALSGVDLELTWSYNQSTQGLKITAGNENFQVMGANYNPQFNIGPRLGFIDALNYTSYVENSSSVVYAEGVLRLARTSGFYVLTNMIDSDNTATPINNANVVAYIPISHSGVSYGDVISITASSMSLNKVQLKTSELQNASAQFLFQILDDEFEPITDTDRGGNCVLFFQMDYD